MSIKHFLLLFPALGLSLPLTFTQAVAEVQQSLITKSTATWCGECGTWSWTFFESLRDSLAGKALLVAAHIGDSFLENETSIEWAANLGISDQPKFYLNNELQNATSVNVAAAFQAIKEQVEENHQTAPLANVGLETVWNGDQIGIKTRTLFFQNGSGAFYLGVYLVEDQVMAAQAGHSGWVPHHRLLRAAVTSPTFGNLMASGPVAAGTEFTKTYTVSTEPFNLDNLDVMGVVWKKEGSVYTVVNVWSINAKPMINAVSDNHKEQGIKASVWPNILSGEEGFIRLVLEGSETLSMDLVAGNGRVVSQIFEGRLPAGEHRIPFGSNQIPSNGWHALRIVTAEGKVVVLPVILR